MILYPAIELRNQRNGAAPTPEVLDHLKQVESFGFERVYVIDRDAQYLGSAFNLTVVTALLQSTSLPAWVGGGVRDISTVRALLNAGAERVILGPMFWMREGALAEAAQLFPGKIIVLIDALSGYVAHDSASDNGAARKRVLDLALAFERLGIAGILYMEHEREGVAGQLDTEVVADLAFALTIPLYVTGGINSMDDLRALKREASTGIAGVILGRALFDSRIDPITALALLKSEDGALS